MSDETDPRPDPAAMPASSDEPLQGRPPGSPYRNLWVPLVVVPFLVVGVLVLVFVFFGAIGGHEATLEENLEAVVNGGANVREQAAVSLAVQAVENRRAELEGRPLAWPVSENFVQKLQDAWDKTERDDAPMIRLALAQLAAQVHDPRALDKLVTFLELTDEKDPRGDLRVPAMVALSWLGDPRAAAHVIPYLRHPQPYLRQHAAAVLQTMPSPETIEALKGVLDDPSLELRGMAAISLSHLGDASGVAVLHDLIDPASYVEAHRLAPDKFASEGLIQSTRVKAVEALARLGREEDREFLSKLGAEDKDPAVREAALRALGGSATGAAR